MSSAPQPATPPTADRPTEVVVISHTPFFYWWPLWAVGFVMAAVTIWYGEPIAFLPEGTKAKKNVTVDGVAGPQTVLVFPAGQPLPAAFETDDAQPRLRMASSNNLGIFWTLTLCFCVVITHVPLRGAYSFMLLLGVVFLTGLFAYFGWWDSILLGLRGLDIHITGAGYLFISLVLFLLWLVTFLVYDRLKYMVFSRGQLRVRMAVGLAETVYDTRGMVVQKHRDALFRHWLLGFGSGDLTVHTAGANAKQFEMPNVLNIDRKLNLIHTMLQEREVTSSR